VSILRTVPGWVHPLRKPIYPSSSGLRFGAGRSGNRPAECGAGHCGVDLLCSVGTPTYSVHDGVVVTAQRNEVVGGSAGRYISINHAGGVAKSYYIHLDKVDVSKGQQVRAGQHIGTVGRTGVKTSPTHLHFAVKEKGKYVNPEPALRSWPTSAGGGLLFLAALTVVGWLAWTRL